MAKYYYEGAEIVTPFSVVSNEPHFDMTTVSLKTQRASQGYQRWELSFNTVNTSSTAVDALLAAVDGIDSSRTFTMPQIVDHTLSTTPTLQGAENAGDSHFVVDLSSATGVLPKGSFIKFSNHNKVYITTMDADFSPSTGSLQVNIYPSLVANISSANTLDIAPDLSYYVDIDNQQGITFSDGVLSSAGTINLIEAI